MNKAIFLDRDGVLNEERGDYTWRKEDFIMRPDVPEALSLLKNAGFLLIVITNQGGINKGLYTATDVLNCHQVLQEKCNFLLDALYYSPYHQDFTQSLSRKPDSLLLERAISHFSIDVTQSYMVGDSPRDLVAASKVGIKGIKIAPDNPENDENIYFNLLEITKKLAFNSKKTTVA